MRKHDALTTRDLRPEDSEAVQRILSTSEYIHYRFEPHELPRLLERYPAVGALSVPPGPLGRVAGGTLQAFVMTTWLVPPSAWIGGFGVTWSQGTHFEALLDLLLPALTQRVAARGARALYYSGADIASDWLLSAFEAHGFTRVSLLRSYDKLDFVVPSWGNQQVHVRPFTPADVDGVVAIERQTFTQRWQHDAASFLEIAATYPYFVVAADAQGVCGYQFNTTDLTTGYLVRIAVHPRVAGQGIGTRLMAEAVRYFQRQHVLKIALNTEEQNTRAQALYERFGFHRIEARGFVIGRALT